MLHKKIHWFIVPTLFFNYTIFYELTLCINVVKLETYESDINGKL
jgi:hypothetical protein